VGVEVLFITNAWAGAWGDIPHESLADFWRDV
jgi:hypothetical protein